MDSESSGICGRSGWLSGFPSSSLSSVSNKLSMSNDVLCSCLSAPISGFIDESLIMNEITLDNNERTLYLRGAGLELGGNNVIITVENLFSEAVFNKVL